MIARGSSTADAAQRAYGVISATAEKNAAMLGFLDCFWLLGFVSLVGLVLSFTIRKFGSSGAAGGH